MSRIQIGIKEIEEQSRLREFYQQSHGGWAHKLSAGPDRQSGALLEHRDIETHGWLESVHRRPLAPS